MLTVVRCAGIVVKAPPGRIMLRQVKKFHNAEVQHQIKEAVSDQLFTQA
jgi:hypothetical protein